MQGDEAGFVSQLISNLDEFVTRGIEKDSLYAHDLQVTYQVLIVIQSTINKGDHALRRENARQRGGDRGGRPIRF